MVYIPLEVQMNALLHSALDAGYSDILYVEQETKPALQGGCEDTMGCGDDQKPNLAAKGNNANYSQIVATYYF